MVAKVYACFWFDVEDYINPESDEALLALLRIFNERRARGTWKLVGEKHRAIKARGRSDIMDALHRQDVGYHTDNHSQHPVMSEYTTGLTWQAGLEEFDRRERPGLEELRHEFGVVSCYGQPGGAWAPQAFSALRRWGVPMYLDEGRHVGLNRQPFWYQGVLTAFNLQENCVRADVWAADKVRALADARSKLDSAVERLKDTGGLISLYYHPCEFACAEFWDAVNFAHGQNPPREQWRPARLISATEAEARLTLFADLLDLALNHPDISVVDATQLLNCYRPERSGSPLPVSELARVAASLGGAITYASTSGGLLSPAEMLGGMVSVLARWASAGSLPAMVAAAAPLGPTERRGDDSAGHATAATIADAARVALAAVQRDGHIPASVSIAGREVGPAGLFAAAAAALQHLAAGGAADGVVAYPGARLLLEDAVGSDRRELWGWVIFPEGFSANDLVEFTRLQAWTLKPAELK